MAKHSILRLSSFIVVLLIAGCCKAPGNKPSSSGTSPEPIWVQNLLVDSSAKLVWSGGIGIPKYKNDVIFSTTLRYTDEIEDNRLCGLDAETGEIMWYFPSDLNQTCNYQLGGRVHIYGDNLVMKSPPLGEIRRENEALCIDLTTRSLKYSYDCRGEMYGAGWNCFGYKQYAVWDELTPNEAHIYKMDISTGNVEPIVDIINNVDYEIDLSVGGFIEQILVYMEYGYNSETYGDYICAYDIETDELIYRQKIDHLSYQGYGLGIRYIGDDIACCTIGPHILAIDTDNGEVIWSVDTKEIPNYFVFNATVCGDKLFMAGHNIYMALDKNTGEILYQKKDAGFWWCATNNGYIYLNTDGDISVLDVNTGNTLAKIVCPEKAITGEVFDIHFGPSFYDGKMYLMSYTTAYCYPAYPW